MKRPVFAFATMIILAASVSFAQPGPKEFKTELKGAEEVPALSTVASGEFELRISNDEKEISYTLKYKDLEGAVTQSHLHLGQPGVNGGISIFLCTNLANGTAQTCPPSPATITGTIGTAQVVGPTAQGIAAGELAEVIRAIREGTVYVNVHTDKFTGGEIRGQIGTGKGRGRPVR